MSTADATAIDPEDALRRGFAIVAFNYGSDHPEAPDDQLTEPGRKPWPKLPEIVAGADRFRTKLADAGAVDHLGEAATKAEPAEVAAQLDDLLTGGQLDDSDTLCVYVGGHGRVLGDDHFIVGPATDPARLTARTALAASDLAAVLAQSRARRVLLMIDACYSGEGAHKAAEVFNTITGRLHGGLRDVYVISSSHPRERSNDGEFLQAILRVLDGDTTRWTEKDRYIESQQLARALTDQLGSETITHIGLNSEGPVLVNPVGVDSAPIELDLKRRTQAHFARSASGIEVGESGWYFTGRTAHLATIATWLQTGLGLLTLTGPPGSGKSAILGRVALLADVEGRRLVVERDPSFDPDHRGNPPLGSIDVAMHARFKTLEEIRREIGQGLGLEPTTGGSNSALIQALVACAPFTLLIDALDEAPGQQSHAIAELLAEIVAIEGTKVLVGTRPDRARSLVSTSRSRGAPLIDALGSAAVTIDLGNDNEDNRRDIAGYVTKRLADRLLSDPYPLDMANAVADEVAERTGSVFLYARLAVQAILAQPRIVLGAGWKERLPAIGSYEAFGQEVEDDLDRIDNPSDRAKVRGLLMAAAFAEGEGVPRFRIWPRMAEAITGEQFDDDDIALTLREASWYLVEASDGQQAVYRLFHEELNRYFREVAQREH